MTHDNARVLMLESDEVIRQSQNIERLHEKASGYMRELSDQRTISWLAMVVIALLLTSLLAIYMYFLQRARLHDERRQMEREQLDFYTQVSHELRTPLTLIEGPLEQLAATPEIQNASDETNGIFAIVRRNTRHLTKLISKLLDAQVGATSATDGDEIDALTVNRPVDTVPSIDDLDENASTVLIVDDNADIRAYLTSILKGKYKVLEACDGQHGEIVAQEQVPDIIVSDVMMPNTNGLEFCQRVKTNIITCHIPVILLTARALNKHQIEGYESGADAYITKPFSSDLLLARIANLLQSRHQLKDLWSTKPAAEVAEEPSPAAPDYVADPFIERFKTIVESQMGNSELSVEDLSREMGLSRVQMYRKVKAITGSTPVDLLRKARLQAAHQLLTSTDMTVSEIAYKVGFASPSYFTKCYKDEYGKVPGESRKK